ncbi:hypothetical protein [Bacillus sp. OAE603]|uniref:hypothetical protein n=1 Tax=Gottfriedia sp. OAE603 TaxID=2663872 RepID=UPI001788EC2A
MKVKDVLRYFGVSVMFLFGAISLIKYVKEDELFMNLLIGFALGVILFFASFLVKEEVEKKGKSS